MRKLLRFIRPYTKESILGPLFKLLEALFELLVPLVIARIVDVAIPSGENSVIIQSVLILVLLAAVGFAASVTAQYFAAKAAIGFSTDLRHAVFAHLHTLSWTDIDRLGTSTLITRLTADINQLQTGVNLALRLLLRSPFVVFGAMIMAFMIDARLAWIFVCVILVLFLIVFGIVLGTMPMQNCVRKDTDQVTAVTRENLTGVRVIRAFRREEAEINRFDQLNDTLTKSQLHAGRFSSALNPLTWIALNLAIIILMQRGAIRIDSGLLTQGQLIALYNYISQILVELVKLANLIVTLTKSAACAGRISSLLDTNASQKDGTEDLSAADVTSLAFDHVSVRYHETGDEALEDISFTAAPGQTIGIIGGTGSGKSTLVHLIPRFYDYTSGEIFIGSHPLPSLYLSSLRNLVAIVPQHASLFQGTIRSNLLWGNPSASDEDLLQALKIAQARSFVNDLDAPVSQGGKNFSGGQRQRLTIARALVKRAPILILDDSSSALDFATDAALRRSLRALPYPCMTFIISQRTSSVRFADQIIVLDDGRCVGIGTHDELLETCPVYRDIHTATMGGKD